MTLRWKARRGTSSPTAQCAGQRPAARHDGRGRHGDRPRRQGRGQMSADGEGGDKRGMTERGMAQGGRAQGGCGGGGHGRQAGVGAPASAAKKPSKAEKAAYTLFCKDERSSWWRRTPTSRPRRSTRCSVPRGRRSARRSRPSGTPRRRSDSEGDGDGDEAAAARAGWRWRGDDGGGEGDGGAENGDGGGDGGAGDVRCGGSGGEGGDGEGQAERATAEAEQAAAKAEAKGGGEKAPRPPRQLTAAAVPDPDSPPLAPHALASARGGTRWLRESVVRVRLGVRGLLRDWVLQTLRVVDDSVPGAGERRVGSGRVGGMRLLVGGMVVEHSAETCLLLALPRAVLARSTWSGRSKMVIAICSVTALLGLVGRSPPPWAASSRGRTTAPLGQAGGAAGQRQRYCGRALRAFVAAGRRCAGHSRRDLPAR